MTKKITSSPSIKLLILAFLFLQNFVMAQENNATIEMADVMRSNGKIYVVVGVILIIFFGIVTYLVVLNKKINNLEAKLKK
ncbi:MAG: CcmD family protein [Bacteroidota bacterium]